LLLLEGREKVPFLMLRMAFQSDGFDDERKDSFVAYRLAYRPTTAPKYVCTVAESWAYSVGSS
jgi:hypothetical protein